MLSAGSTPYLSRRGGGLCTAPHQVIHAVRQHIIHHHRVTLSQVLHQREILRMRLRRQFLVNL
jgi:hypothetical protein